MTQPDKIGATVTNLESEQANPLDLLDLMFPTTARAIAIAAHNRVANLLAEGARPVVDLAADAGAHAPSLQKVLRILTEDGIFTEPQPGVFQNTPLSELLRDDVPASQHTMAKLVGEPWLWASWGALDHCVNTGGASFEQVYQTKLWPWLGSNQESARIFNGAMTDISEAVGPPAAKAYPDLGDSSVVADLGGGEGTFLAEIVSQYPSIDRGVLVDLPAVIESAQQRPALKPLVDAGRFDFFGGDFFTSVPESVDIYVTKQIMHSWNDDQVIALLTKCREASPSARFAAVELVHDETSSRFVRNFDLVMLVTMAGAIRTVDDFAKLFEKAGYELRRTIPTTTAFSIIEAVPST